MRTTDELELLNQKEAAAFLRLVPNTLLAWRSRKQPGPAYIRVGGRIFYDKKDLITWLASRRVTPSKGQR